MGVLITVRIAWIDSGGGINKAPGRLEVRFNTCCRQAIARAQALGNFERPYCCHLSSKHIR